jgi:hypothetical protein
MKFAIVLLAFCLILQANSSPVSVEQSENGQEN